MMLRALRETCGILKINLLLFFFKVQGQPLMVQVSGGQLITPSGQPIMVQAMPGGQTQTIMQLPVTGSQGLQQVSRSVCVCGIKELHRLNCRVVCYKIIN